MKTFKHPNLSIEWRCPFCGRYCDRPVGLTPVRRESDSDDKEAGDV